MKPCSLLDHTMESQEMAILSARATQKIAFIWTAYKCLGKAWEMVMKMEISQFPVISPFLLARQSSLALHSARPMLLPSPGTFSGQGGGMGISPGFWAALHSEVSGEIHFLLHCAELQPFNNHLASWLGFVCGGVFFLFSNYHFCLVGWEYLCPDGPHPRTFRSVSVSQKPPGIFFLLPQEGPSVCSMLPILLINLKTCSLCKTTL